MIKNLLKLGAAAAITVLLAACAAQQPHPMVGHWDATISTPMGNMNAELVVNEDLTGNMRSADLGASGINDITLDGQQVTFNTEIDAQGMMMTLQFSGEVDGDSLSGAFDTDFGPLSVNATRR